MNLKNLTKGVAAALCLVNGVSAKTNESKPNIIYILADDLGYGDIGCYGQTEIKTPNIDKLAQKGIKFVNHYAGSTVSAPSRSCLLTGNHTGHTYIKANGNYQMRPNPEDKIIPTYLKEAGYVSAMIGKSGTGCRCKPAHPNEKGFDYFYGYLSHGQAHSYFPKFMHENGKQIDFPNNGGNKTWRGDTYSHDLFLEKALKFLDNNKDQPFFLHYSAALPHAQVYVPDEFKKDYLGKYPEKEFGGKGKRKHYGHTKDPNATTAGMIARLDWEIGKIVEKIEELGLTENTVIMFSSDNGPHQEGGRKPAFFKSSGEYKGIKRDLYDGGVKVPFIVKWPNVINENQVSEHVSAFWDVLPTLTDMAGLRSPDGLDGISFLPTLKGQQQKKHSCLYWEFHERGGKVAVLKDGWKLILMNAKKKKSSFELYNLKNDIHEDHNLAKNYPEKVKEMYELMKSQHEDSEIGKLKFKRFEEVKIN